VSHFAGADWLVSVFGVKRPVSAFGRRVADLLGDLYAGIYHITREVKNPKVQWSDEAFISVVVRGNGFATFDSSLLTRLVVLCHDRCIRCDVQPATPKHLRLVFHARKGREGGCSERHPTMEGAVERLRESWGKEHAA
jgi:hypothetical protein